MFQKIVSIVKYMMMSLFGPSVAICLIFLEIENNKTGLRQCEKLQDLGWGDCCDYCYRGKKSQILLCGLCTKSYFVDFTQNLTL